MWLYHYIHLAILTEFLGYYVEINTQKCCKILWDFVLFWMTSSLHKRETELSKANENWRKTVQTVASLSYKYRNSHDEDKTILWLYDLRTEIIYTSKMTSSYWIRKPVLCLCHVVSSILYGMTIYIENIYCQTCNISRTLIDSKIVDHSDVVGASAVGAASTTSSFST